jgi:hypothetical protein
MKRYVMFAIAVGMGLLVEIAITAMTGETEAWDSKYYLRIGYPIICLTSLGLTYFDPTRKWKWAVLPMMTEIVFLLIRNGFGNLFPLALIFNMVWFIGPFTLANIGEALSKSTSGRTPNQAL